MNTVARKLRRIIKKKYQVSIKRPKQTLADIRDEKNFLQGAALALGLCVSHVGIESSQALEVLSQMGYDLEDLKRREVEPYDIANILDEDYNG